ncbi:hypothetical protein NUITMVRE34_30820 [Enterococcus gallinarum]|nr:hypothetical protein NUITMVRE34_30820 [Enterococcus gallinarum]GMS52936.1 hypothetical protein NUITMVRE35_30720 [Enterococcus gallinarum]
MSSALAYLLTASSESIEYFSNSTVAEEYIEEYREEIDENLPTGEVFYLKTKGNSMVPTIPSDSYVLIRRQPVVEDGEIAAVIVNGDTEATLKRS